MNEIHPSCENGVHDITSPSNNKFHKEQQEWWAWACLDIVNEILSCFPWHSINV
jgi:hypothetical protein